MLGLLIVVTVVGLYLIGHRLQIIINILSAQMPDEAKKEMASAEMENNWQYDPAYKVRRIAEIKNMDASSITILLPKGNALSIYLVVGLLAWIAVELGGLALISRLFLI